MNTQTLQKYLQPKLNKLIKQAEQYHKQACGIVEAEHKSKLLAKRKHQYSLNPHRTERIHPDEIKDKALRKEAREVERKLFVNLDNLLLNKSLVTQNAQEVKRQAELVIANLQRLENALQELPKWVKYTEEQAKLLRYERRNEISLTKRIFGTEAPPKASSNNTGASEGEIKMAKKDTTSIKELLTKLENEVDQKQKRLIRAALRRLGHRGGLGKKTAKKVVKKTTKKTAKKTTKKATKKTAKKATKKTAKKAAKKSDKS